MFKNMQEKLKNYKVNKKLSYAFSIIIIGFVLTLLIAGGGMVFMNAHVKSFYEKAYANTSLQLEIRKDIQMVGKHVLWAVTEEDDAGTQEKIETAEIYAGYVAENIALLQENFDNEALVAELEAAVSVLKSSRQEVLELASSHKNDEALALFNSDYNAATETVQDILIKIGEQADTEAAFAYNASRISGFSCQFVMGILSIFCIVTCVKLSKMITSIICSPIEELANAATQLRNGNLDTTISYEGEDELGALATDFRAACAQMHDVIVDTEYILEEMADGNINVHTRAEDKYVGTFSLILRSIRKLNRHLDSTLRQMNDVSDQVAAGSAQMAGSSQSLAEGATDQSAAIQQLTATVENVTNIAVESAEVAQQSAHGIKATAAEAAKSREDMEKLTSAMNRITETSKEIENIIGAIEEIASQTNLLSLNASIEAARAGEAGRGFAVVADQIGKLANDSAQSAVTTRELIGKALAEIEHGNEITQHTADVINNILANMDSFVDGAAGSAEASRNQAELLKQVESGIEQISSVVESNSAAAQETSAISEELSAQAESLREMVAQFKLRD